VSNWQRRSYVSYWRKTNLILSAQASYYIELKCRYTKGTYRLICFSGKTKYFKLFQFGKEYNFMITLSSKLLLPRKTKPNQTKPNRTTLIQYIRGCMHHDLLCLVHARRSWPCRCHICYCGLSNARILLDLWEFPFPLGFICFLLLPTLSALHMGNCEFSSPFWSIQTFGTHQRLRMGTLGATSNNTKYITNHIQSSKMWAYTLIAGCLVQRSASEISHKYPCLKR